MREGGISISSLRGTCKYIFVPLDPWKDFCHQSISAYTLLFYQDLILNSWGERNVFQLRDCFQIWWRVLGLLDAIRANRSFFNKSLPPFPMLSKIKKLQKYFNLLDINKTLINSNISSNLRMKNFQTCKALLVIHLVLLLWPHFLSQ